MLTAGLIPRVANVLESLAMLGERILELRARLPFGGDALGGSFLEHRTRII
jgi:hypothetical protein